MRGNGKPAEKTDKYLTIFFSLYYSSINLNNFLGYVCVESYINPEDSLKIKVRVCILLRISWGRPVSYSVRFRSARFPVYTLKNPNSMPLKLKIIQPNFTVYHHHENGPTFGYWHDLYISDKSNLKKDSYVWSQSYEYPNGNEGYNGGEFIYGAYGEIQIADIEVFKLKN